jgi:SAM-dependent methyltransferase
MSRTIQQRQIPIQFKEKAGSDFPIFDDPAFMDNRSVPVHRWVPWIAGFSGAFVDSALSAFLNGRKDTGLVLDPFAGVGTTLLQAAVRGHKVAGFEINPYAALSANVKLNALEINTTELDHVVRQMKKDARRWRNGSADRPFSPPGFQSRIPFFSPMVAGQVSHALMFISEIENEMVRDLFRVAFGSVMVSFSNYTYEPSLSTRTAAGKPLINDADVAGTIIEKLLQMQSDINWLRFETGEGGIAKGIVYNEDFFEGNRRLEDGSIDLMVTSPPYLNNYHYARNTRPQLYWLGLISSPKEQKHLEERNFGTFWQVARTKRHVNLNFSHPELEGILEQMRQINPEKGEYGGTGWANYAASYFNDCEHFLKILRRCLRKGGVGVIVVGNSILQGINVRVQDIIGDIACMCGLELEGVYRLRTKRVGDSITSSSVRSVTSRAKLDESAVVLRKK